MKNILTYTILAACILALSACSHKQLDPPAPEIEVDKTALISFSTGIAGTKGLIEDQDALDNANTVIQVYDYMTPTSGSDVKYIDDRIVGNTTGGSWSYENPNTVYYWTKTGTHHFFGWLVQQLDKETTDSAGNTSSTVINATDLFGDSKPSFEGMKVSVPAIEMTPSSKQFDFLYSGIVSRNSADPQQHTTVLFEDEAVMKHLFSALAVTVINQTGSSIDISSFNISNFDKECSAEIDYSGATGISSDAALTTIEADPTVVRRGAFEPYAFPKDANNENAIIPLTIANGTSVNMYTGTAITSDNSDFRLIWQQDDTANSSINVTYKKNDHDYTKSASLSGVFKDQKDTGGNIINKMLPGKKYRLTVTITAQELYIEPTILPWEIASEYTFESSITTSLRCIDASYRGINLSAGWQNNWAEYMAISYGYQDKNDQPVTPPPSNEDRPRYASRIELHTVSNNTDLLLGLDNDKFKFVLYHEETYQYTDDNGIAQTGTRQLYDHTYTGGQSISIPAGDNTIYFYVVPVSTFDNDATVADKTCHVYLVTSSNTLGAIRQPFNFNALPGNSAGSDEIWVYYVIPSDYSDDEKTSSYPRGN